MIVFSQLGNKGHLGNQLFQIASVIGLAKKHNMDFGFPAWKWAGYFEIPLPEIPERHFNLLPETKFHWHEWPIEADKDYDLDGWLQSEKYFDRKRLTNYFTFKPSLIAGMKKKFSALLSKQTIVISIRRGDFVNHPDYFQLPVLYYILALEEHFPDWRNRNILVTSDDVTYCKIHFSFLENAFFADQLNAAEQLLLASLCDDFIISNSTFSWWTAYLGEKSHSKIIRPAHYFRGAKAQKDSDADFFPERWKLYDHREKKLSLDNTTLILRPVTASFINQKNGALAEGLLMQNFETDIRRVAKNTKGLSFMHYEFLNAESRKKSREVTSASLREIIENCDNQYILVIDDNAILPPFAIFEAVNRMADTQTGITFSKVCHVPEKPFLKMIRIHMDIGVVKSRKTASAIVRPRLGMTKSKINTLTTDNPKIPVQCHDALQMNVVVYLMRNRPMLYFGIEKIYSQWKFRLYSFRKFYIKPLFSKSNKIR